jgi:hypothetical protein
MGDFESKGHTNPTLMWGVLRRLHIRFHTTVLRPDASANAWPRFGLARVQWEGPWTAAGVPVAARYRHTHWVGADTIDIRNSRVFDINAIRAGGWISLDVWAGQLVPWLLEQCEPKADGRWHLTHAVEVFA